MIIKSGYWNYYMSFRIKDNKKLFQDIINKEYNDSIIGIALEKGLLQNTTIISEYLEKRENDVKPYLEQKMIERWSISTEQEKYKNNELPECYFDFVNEGDRYGDKLRNAYESELAEIRECNKAVIDMTHENSKDCWLILAMMPLKIEIHPFTYEFCPVHMYLFENGHAVIKTSIPLEDIDAGSLATYPMQTWFWDVKVWEAAIKQGGRQEYKIVQEPGNEENISFISHLLQQCVYRLFENNLLDAKRFCSFETLVIAETERKQIWEIPGKGSVAEKEDLYHLANPEEFASVFSMDRWYAFWEKAHQHFVGIDFIKGQHCRLIITTDAARMQKRHRGREIGELGSYLNVSVQRTFDFYLVLALCQKDGEMYLAKASQENIHEVEKQLALYNSNCNFFETFLDTIPYDARRFYSMIYEMNNNSFVDVKTRIERIKQMEDYQRKNFLQKRTLIVELVALIGTILFGLPTLTDTLTILRECFLPAGDLIPGNIVQLCAVGTWLLLIGLISRYLHKAYTEYEKKKL